MPQATSVQHAIRLNRDHARAGAHATVRDVGDGDHRVAEEGEHRDLSPPSLLK